MRRSIRQVMLVVVTLLSVAIDAPAIATPHVAIMTSDVDRFFTVFDSANGAPGAQELQARYIDTGSDAFRAFAADRHVTGASLAAAIRKDPAVFSGARRCASALPAVRRRLTVALTRLAALYPPARFPPVTIVIGRGATGGTTNRSGVIIGLETLCDAPYLDPDITARFVHLIAHEYAHVQQPAAQGDPEKPTVLYGSIIEGGAELIAELISGDVGNYQFKRWTAGREKDIETRFQTEMESTRLDDWLWHGPGTAEHPGDLGYWVGYRIARAYLIHAPDTCRALREIIEVDDPHLLVAHSGWTPGMAMAPLPRLPTRCPA